MAKHDHADDDDITVYPPTTGLSGPDAAVRASRLYADLYGSLHSVSHGFERQALDAEMRRRCEAGTPRQLVCWQLLRAGLLALYAPPPNEREVTVAQQNQTMRDGAEHLLHRISEPLVESGSRAVPDKMYELVVPQIERGVTSAHASLSVTVDAVVTYLGGSDKDRLAVRQALRLDPRPKPAKPSKSKQAKTSNTATTE